MNSAVNTERIRRLLRELESSSKCEYLVDTHTENIRFTEVGLKEYRSRFARAGIDIRRIKTREQLKSACQRSLHVAAGDLLKAVEGHTDLEKALEPLKAIRPC